MAFGLRFILPVFDPRSVAKKRMTVRGVAGDFVVKYKGDEGVTGTENGDF